MSPARWVSTSPVTIAVAFVLVASCGGQKKGQAYIPVPVNPSPPARAVRPLPDQAFRVEWLGHDVPGDMKAGTRTDVTVTFKNVSTLPWPDPDSTSYEPPQAGAVRLTYRWQHGSEPPRDWAGRADLRRLLKPGQAASLSIAVIAPRVPGYYLLTFDLVQEMAAFFGDKGATRLVVPVRIAR